MLVGHLSFTVDCLPLSILAPVRSLLSLLLALGIGLSGIALGEWLLDTLGIRLPTDGERLAFTGGVGLGAMGYGLLALGFVGLLRPWAIWTMLALAAFLSWSQVRRWLTRRRSNLAGASQRSLFAAAPGFFERLGATLVIAMVAVVLVRGLAPVTDYDGLTYHLVVPRDYLRAGRIFSYPGEAHGNFPLTVDMLYIPSILLGLENAARLIHLEFGVLLGVGVYALAKRLLGSRAGGWLALFALGTTPILGTVGGYAHTDLGWALFEFLAAYALLCWREEGERRWLLLAGIFAGLGMGSKYHGVLGLGALGAVVVAHHLSRSGLLTRRTWQRVLSDGLSFGLVALAVASPWYLKNWLWLGNPVYPTWFGGRGWDAYQSANLAFMGTRYGPRRGVLGFLLLPWDLFRYPIGYFGPVPFAFPTPLSLMLPFYLFVRRRPVVNLILLFACVRFGSWAVSARNARYLMDVYPLLAVVMAYLLAELSRRRGGQRLVQGGVLVLLVANLSWQALLLVQEDPIPVVLGLESRDDYLAEHNQPPYQAIRFINQLPADSRIFFIGNGQSYYVTADHVADVSHGNWGHLVYLWGEEPDHLHEALKAQGITHIYYSGYDLAWRLNFDFEGGLAHELALFEQFAARCADVIYDHGEDGQVFALLEECKD